MNCQEVEERDIPELYLLDRLTELEREDFEKHYFECSTCFSQLQAGLAIQTALRHQPLSPTRASAASLLRIWAWTPVWAACVLLFGVGVWWYSSQKHQPGRQVASPPLKTNPELLPQPQPQTAAAPPLEELARVEPPPYSAVVLRGAEGDAQETFRKAMQYYVKRDYAHAIPGVRTAVEASPGTASFNLYLGACYLLTGQTNSAIEFFRKTVSLGDPAYSESAHFYLAKAYLRKKEVADAEQELRETVRLHGSLEAEAQEILRQLSM